MSDFSKVAEFLRGCSANGTVVREEEVKASSHVTHEEKAVSNSDNVISLPVRGNTYLIEEEDIVEIAPFAKEAFELNRLRNNQAIREREEALKRRTTRRSNISNRDSKIINLFK